MCANLADVRPARRVPPRPRAARSLAPRVRLAACLAAALWAPSALAVCFPLSITRMTFTGYTPATGAEATATLSYMCVGNTTSATVSISTPRTIRAGANTLQFELYTLADHNTVFPGMPPLAIPVVTTGTVTVYGVLPPQNAAAGNYTGRLTVTLTSNGTTTSTVRLNVRANIPPTCTIQAALLSFGVYDTLAAAPATGQGTIVIQCTVNAQYWVDLGLGSYASGTTRRMATPGFPDRLTYELYDQGGTVWKAPYRVTNTATTSAPVSLVVRGQIPPQQPVPAGTYYDYVQATIEF